jgi:hypothetical protein
MIEEKRRHKNIPSAESQAKYKELRNKIQRECKKAKEQWWEAHCEDIESCVRQGRSDLAYRKAREMTCRKRDLKSRTIRDEQGREVSGDERGEMWHKYVEDLYAVRPQERVISEEAAGQEDSGIMRAEFDQAMRALPFGKAAGIDNIPAELWKSSGPAVLAQLYNLVNAIYETGQWPEEHCTAVIVPIPKKAAAKACKDYRTLSLVSHASKVLLYILRRRMEMHVECFLDETQFGFRKHKSTRDAISVLRVIGERFHNIGRTMYVCFIDYEKAFDRVSWSHLFPLLRRIGCPESTLRLVMDLYKRQQAVIRLDDGDTKPALIRRGVRQGCSLSPGLFNVFAEMILHEALIERDGIRIGGRTINAVKFADDQAIPAGSPSRLQKMLRRLNSKVKKYGMRINIQKTKTMAIGRNTSAFSTTIDGQLLQQVSSFKYLGSTIASDGCCSHDVRARVAMAKAAFREKQGVLTSKSISLELRKRIAKAYVWSVALYGAETWTLNKKDEKRLEAFEMWCWRNLEQIRWQEHRTNAQVLEQVNEERHLLKSIKQRRLRWVGHVLRHGGLLRDVIEGRIEGKRPRGRPRNTWVANLLRDTECTGYQQMKEKANDRERWREIMVGAN